MLPALILAGGLGTRLAKTVPNLPKSLAPIHNTPFLQLLLQQLQETKIISKVVLALGHRAPDVIDYLHTSLFSFPIEISLESAPLGTGGAILNALDKIDSDYFLTMNGDSFFDLPFVEFLSFHRKMGAQLTIACTELDEASRYGMIKMNADSQIISFSEKSHIPLKGWVSTGIYLMQKNLFSTLPKTPCSLEKDLFPQILASGTRDIAKRQGANEDPKDAAKLMQPKTDSSGCLGIYGFPHAGTFIDIGTHLSYHEAQKTLKPWILT